MQLVSVFICICLQSSFNYVSHLGLIGNLINLLVFFALGIFLDFVLCLLFYRKPFSSSSRTLLTSNQRVYSLAVVYLFELFKNIT